MGEELNQAEIRKRLQKLRNYERLHPILKRKYEAEKKENRMLKERLAFLERKVEEQALIIEELRKMVFGKKKKKDKGGDEDKEPGDSGKGKGEKKPRSKASYRRPKPKEEEVTETNEYFTDECPECRNILSDLKTIIRYIEDMELANEVMNKLKKVEKRIITSGYCDNCEKRVSLVPIPKNEVVLGEQVKWFITYAVVILRLSYEQIKSYLRDVVDIAISDGEISNILTGQTVKLLPEFHRVHERVRGQPGAHYDETGHKVQKGGEGNYAWVKTGTKTPDAIFLFGRSRGKGVAEELKQESSEEQVGISDNYAVYKNTFKHHALCWAHPKRKLKDLAEAKILSKKKRKHCQQVYAQFCQLYADLEECLAEPFNLTEREQAKSNLLPRLETLVLANENDPKKLRILKEGLLRDKEKYFTCLLFPGIPADNNKAERALRHLVLKRKCSYGSKTQKGADVKSVLFSTLLSLWWKKPKNFFSAYQLILKTA